MDAERVNLADETDLIRLRARLREIAAGADDYDLTRLLTVASELGRNTLEHGGGGRCEIRWRDGNMRAIRLAFVDAGPGIADIGVALTDGRSGRDGLGLGLGGSRRLADDFRIESPRGGGARVTVTLSC